VDEKTRDIYRRAIAVWGANAQWRQVVEECAELIVEISHMQRGRATASQITDEVADVQIMLDQAALMIGPAVIEKYKKAKLERLANRVAAAERDRKASQERR
jgi:hypothetical protein